MKSNTEYRTENNVRHQLKGPSKHDNKVLYPRSQTARSAAVAGLTIGDGIPCVMLSATSRFVSNTSRSWVYECALT